MNALAYYNENDPFAAGWLRNLIRAGHIAPGEVDERSIVNVRPDDLRAFRQCHFFAGIGGWSIALRLAGWPDEKPVWTGSCPCQPFSAAGAGKAADDERHLWPAWLPLIAECRPPVVFGEQVEAAIGWGWLDAVFSDLEEQGYACGATILPACGVGAPHIRQRCWFVANSEGEGRQRLPGRGREALSDRAGSGEAGGHASIDGIGTLERQPRSGGGSQEPSGGSGLSRDVADPTSGGQRELGDASRQGRSGHADSGIIVGELGNADRLQPEQPSRERTRPGEAESGRPRGQSAGSGDIGGMADSERDGGRTDEPQRGSQGRVADGRLDPWSGCDWLPCTDGKARPVRPGSFPLAHGVQRRTSKLRAYGNAIVPQVAAEFIAAYLDTVKESKNEPA